MCKKKGGERKREMIKNIDGILKRRERRGIKKEEERTEMDRK